jgi:hypothetical protein
MSLELKKKVRIRSTYTSGLHFFGLDTPFVSLSFSPSAASASAIGRSFQAEIKKEGSWLRTKKNVFADGKRLHMPWGN